MTTLLLVIVIISTAIEHIAILGIHLYNQIPILTFGATADVMLMYLVVGHEITNFRLIGADP